MKTRKASHWFALIVVATVLGACAGAPDVLQPNAQLQCRPDHSRDGANIAFERGMGGTGISTERGSGGTGVMAQDRGMGGTGIGIIGTITGFGSICVNGVKIAYTQETPVIEDGTPSNAENLAQGQTVVVSAMEAGGLLSATSISVSHTLRGPVTVAPESNGELTVMGVPIVTAYATGINVSELSVDDVVTVDGLQREDGTVDATRIVAAPSNSGAFIRGVAEVTEGSVAVGAVPILFTDSSAAEPETLNRQWAYAAGEWVDGQLRVETFTVGGDLNTETMQRLSIEGYLIGAPNEPYRIRGIPLAESSNQRLSRTTLDQLSRTQRVNVVGQVENDGALRVQTIVVPEYRSPLFDGSIENQDDSQEVSGATRTDTQTRDQVQSERGTYRTTITRTDALTTDVLDVRSDTLRSRPISDVRPTPPRDTPPRLPPPRPPPPPRVRR